MLRELRDGIATATGETPAPLEQLVRVRGRTLFMIAALSAAFYVLLPQLADIGDSVDAIGSANWWWLAVCFVMSFGTYLFAAVALAGGVPERLPFVPNLAAQMASSFVNRVTPANVGGMALNLRFLQKAGVAPAEAVTGIGLNVAAGGIAHVLLLLLFVAWAGQSDTNSFQIPSSSKLLVIIAVVLALIGMIAATRWGRRVVLTRVVKFLPRFVDELGDAGALTDEDHRAGRRFVRHLDGLHLPRSPRPSPPSTAGCRSRRSARSTWARPWSRPPRRRPVVSGPWKRRWWPVSPAWA